MGYQNAKLTAALAAIISPALSNNPGSELFLIMLLYASLAGAKLAHLARVSRLETGLRKFLPRCLRFVNVRCFLRIVTFCNTLHLEPELHGSVGLQ